MGYPKKNPTLGTISNKEAFNPPSNTFYFILMACPSRKGKKLKSQFQIFTHKKVKFEYLSILIKKYFSREKKNSEGPYGERMLQLANFYS